MMFSSGTNRRRSPRAHHLARPATLFCPKLSSEPMKVLDISSGGVKVELDSNVNPMALQQDRLEAYLRIEGHSPVAVELRLAHRSERHAGFEFRYPLQRLKDLIDKQYRFELLGAGLQAIQDPGTPDVLELTDRELVRIVVRFKDGKIVHSPVKNNELLALLRNATGLKEEERARLEALIGPCEQE